MTTTTDTTRYFVAPAPGCYGDRTDVLSSHRTLRAARRAAGRPITVPGGGRFWYAVRRGELRKGQALFRVDESVYPVVREG